MSITPRGMSVQEAYRLYREGRLVVNRKYQRKLVWTIEEKQGLVDSIIKDYPVPLILLAEVSKANGSHYEIIDGMQRLNAIFSFIETNFSINGRYFDIDEFSRAKQAAEAGAFASVQKDGSNILDALTCANILDYQLATTIFPIDNEEQITDIFGRINSGGRQLSAQEKRQAGMVDEFSMSVRKLASDIRGDTSRDKLPLFDMPEISIDTARSDMGYMLKAQDIFWCKQGILWAKQLRDSEDEEMLADVCASIIVGGPIARSKEYLDIIYDISSVEYVKIRRSLTAYGADRLMEEVRVTLSVLREIVESVDPGANALRNVINPGARNPIKASFYALFMSLHDLVVSKEMTPDDNEGIMKALSGLQRDMKSTAKVTTTDDRVKNVDKTTGLIQKFFVKKDPPMLRHGAGLALDMENSLRRSRVETSRYECKQGLIDLSLSRKVDLNLPNKIIETICGIANVGPDADGFIFIGVADKLEDAKRISEIDGVKYITVGVERYVVGVDREVRLLSLKPEHYLEKILAFIRNSDLSEPLKNHVMTQIDYVEYKGMSVVRIRIPSQKTVSFVGEKAYIREGSSTIEATGKKLLAVNDLFS